MQPASLAGTTQDSKVKRQERLKSRFRDRGGCVFISWRVLGSPFNDCSIFVPLESNPLVDILLARGINGDSPAKRRSLRKSALTPKLPRSAASKVTQTKTPTRSPTKTPHTGARKSAARKLHPSRNEGKENCAPRPRKLRDSSNVQKRLRGDRRTDGAPLCQIIAVSLHSRIAPLRRSINVCCCFTPRRHGHWCLCKALSVPYSCPRTHTLFRSACKRKCVLRRFISDTNVNTVFSFPPQSTL